MPGIKQSAVIPVEGTLLSLALMLVCIRLFLRLVLQRTRLTLSDWFLVASAVDAIALFATDNLAHKYGAMDSDDAPPRPLAQQIALLKVEFAGDYFYDTGIYFPKLALLAFYHRLIPNTMPKLRKWLYVVSGLTACFMFATCMVDTFWCGVNVPRNWDPNSSCIAYYSQTITRIDWSLNFTADLMIFSLPFPLLSGLKVNRKYMIGLIATFGSGVITLGASVSRFVTVNVIYAWTDVYVLSMTEMVSAIFVVCLPALKSFLGKIESVTTTQRRGGSNTTGSGYNNNQYSSAGHIKLSSGRDPYSTVVRVAATAPGDEDSGSEVELNSLGRDHVIYRSDRVSVTYERKEDKA